MLEVGTLVSGAVNGPILGLFLAGMLLPWVIVIMITMINVKINLVIPMINQLHRHDDHQHLVMISMFAGLLKNEHHHS